MPFPDGQRNGGRSGSSNRTRSNNKQQSLQTGRKISRSLSPKSIRKVMSPVISPVMRGLRKISKPDNSSMAGESLADSIAKKGDESFLALEEESSAGEDSFLSRSMVVSSSKTKDDGQNPLGDFPFFDALEEDPFAFFDRNNTQGRRDFQEFTMTLLGPSNHDIVPTRDEEREGKNKKRHGTKKSANEKDTDGGRSKSERRSKPAPPGPAETKSLSFSAKHDKPQSSSSEEFPLSSPSSSSSISSKARGAKPGSNTSSKPRNGRSRDKPSLSTTLASNKVSSGRSVASATTSKSTSKPISEFSALLDRASQVGFSPSTAASRRTPGSPSRRTPGSPSRRIPDSPSRRIPDSPSRKTPDSPSRKMLSSPNGKNSDRSKKAAVRERFPPRPNRAADSNSGSNKQLFSSPKRRRANSLDKDDLSSPGKLTSPTPKREKESPSRGSSSSAVMPQVPLRVRSMSRDSSIGSVRSREHDHRPSRSRSGSATRSRTENSPRSHSVDVSRNRSNARPDHNFLNGDRSSTPPRRSSSRSREVNSSEPQDGGGRRRSRSRSEMHEDSVDRQSRTEPSASRVLEGDGQQQEQPRPSRSRDDSNRTSSYPNSGGNRRSRSRSERGETSLRRHRTEAATVPLSEEDGEQRKKYKDGDERQQKKHQRRNSRSRDNANPTTDNRGDRPRSRSMTERNDSNVHRNSRTETPDVPSHEGNGQPHLQHRRRSRSRDDVNPPNTTSNGSGRQRGRSTSHRGEGSGHRRSHDDQHVTPAHEGDERQRQKQHEQHRRSSTGDTSPSNKSSKGDGRRSSVPETGLGSVHRDGRTERPLAPGHGGDRQKQPENRRRSRSREEANASSKNSNGGSRRSSVPETGEGSVHRDSRGDRPVAPVHGSDRQKVPEHHPRSRSRDDANVSSKSPRGAGRRIGRSESDRAVGSGHQGSRMERPSASVSEKHGQIQQQQQHEQPRDEANISFNSSPPPPDPPEDDQLKSYRRGKRPSRQSEESPGDVTGNKEEVTTGKPSSARSLASDETPEKQTSGRQLTVDRNNLARETLANVRDIKKDLKQMRSHRRRTEPESPIRVQRDSNSVQSAQTIKLPLSAKSPAVGRGRRKATSVAAEMAAFHQSLNSFNGSRLSSSQSDLNYSARVIGLDDLNIGFFNRSSSSVATIPVDEARIHELQKQIKDVKKAIKRMTREIWTERDQTTSYQQKNWSLRKSLMLSDGPEDSVTALNLKIERLLRQHRELDTETDQLRDHKDTLGENCTEMTARIDDTKKLFDKLTKVVVPLLPVGNPSVNGGAASAVGGRRSNGGNDIPLRGGGLSTSSSSSSNQQGMMVRQTPARVVGNLPTAADIMSSDNEEDSIHSDER